MKLLVAFLLAVLGCSLAEGRIVTKCELRDQLVRETANLTDSQKVLTGSNFVAKAVCHAELSSGFNTTVVNEVNPENRGDDSKEQKGSSKPRKQRSPKGPAPPKWPAPAPPQPNNTWKLYGLFQLGDKVACNGMSPSANICGTSCSNFLNDDVTDDINCLLKIVTNPPPTKGRESSESNEESGEQRGRGSGQAPSDKLKTMLRLIFQNECKDKQDASYFADCP